MLRAIAQPVLQAMTDARIRIGNRIDPPVLVLLYHRIATLPADADLLAVTPERFREQLRWIKDRLSFARFEADWSKIDKPAVAVTFDDGYADNFHAALPILDELGVPATFFITSGNVDSAEEFWWDELARLLPGVPGTASLELPVRSTRHRLDTSTEAARQHAYARTHRLLFDAPVDERRGILKALREWSDSNGAVRQSHRALSTTELQSLADNPLVTIGAHTVNHARLAVLDVEEQRREITASKAALETRLGRRIEVFAYPFGGRRDYTPQTTAICRETGFRKAASNFPGNAHRWTDPLQIPRHLVRNWDVGEFAMHIESFLAR